MLADYKPGATVLLKRNPNYWKSDEQGRKLPYLDSIRVDIQPNRDVEMLRFKRGELDLINSLDSEYFDKLEATSPQLVHDAGPSLDSEQLWFNQVAKAPIPVYKKNWFRSANFRKAISEAINREDLSRIVFHGHAQPAAGPFSPRIGSGSIANSNPRLIALIRRSRRCRAMASDWKTEPSKTKTATQWSFRLSPMPAVKPANAWRC
jgi:ABC-type transport system substrate-binding protein